MIASYFEERKEFKTVLRDTTLAFVKEELEQK